VKRLLPVATVLVALLLPSSAVALSTGYYTGSNSQGLPLKFQVIKKSKKVGKKRVYTYYAKLYGPLHDDADHLPGRLQGRFQAEHESAAAGEDQRQGEVLLQPAARRLPAEVQRDGGPGPPELQRQRQAQQRPQRRDPRGHLHQR
jgi:hypothetical protein